MVSVKPPHGIQAVVFDVDGTLVNAFEDIASSANAAFCNLGLPSQTRDQIIAHVGYGLHHLAEKVLGEEFSGRIESFKKAFREYYTNHCGENAFLYPCAEHLLRYFSEQGIKKAVLTNKPYDLTVRTLEVLGLEGAFNVIIGDGKGFEPKPDPSSFLHICGELGVRPGQALMVGDGNTDMLTAKNAGAPAWGVAQGLFTEAELKALGAERTFPALSDLYEYLTSGLVQR